MMAAASPSPGGARRVEWGRTGMENANAEASIDIDAPPELVYDLIADVTTMPEWAAETHRCRWLGGATEAVVGAKFRGSHRHKGRRWSATSPVTAADRGRR